MNGLGGATERSRGAELMSRFKWQRQSSRSGLIAAVVTRVTLRGLTVEAALIVSLPHYAVNPEALSQLEHKRIIRDAQSELKRVEESRRSCTGNRRMRG